MKNQKFVRRLSFALAGISLALRTENSFRTQFVFALLAIAAMAVIGPPIVWWAIVGLVVVLVLSAELMNTSIETLCDFLEPNHNEEIKKTKDFAAAAVLVISFGSLWIAICVVLAVFT